MMEDLFLRWVEELAEQERDASVDLSRLEKQLRTIDCIEIHSSRATRSSMLPPRALVATGVGERYASISYF